MFTFDEAELELKKRAKEIFDSKVYVFRSERENDDHVYVPCICMLTDNLNLAFHLSDEGKIFYAALDDYYDYYDEAEIEKMISDLQNGLKLFRQFRDEQDKNRQA